MTEDLNLLYTDVEDSLRASVRDLLTDRCPPDRVIALYDGDRSLVPGLWKALAVDLGLAGLLVPEEYGGAGASAREAAVVLEELGRSAAPVPFLSSAVATLLPMPVPAPVTMAVFSVMAVIGVLHGNRWIVASQMTRAMARRVFSGGSDKKGGHWRPP